MKFEQSFHLLCTDKKKIIKTPGEEGKYLIEIRVWDTQHMKNVPSDQGRTRVHKKERFVSWSSSDQVYISKNNILKLSLDRIRKVKGASNTLRVLYK